MEKTKPKYKSSIIQELYTLIDAYPNHSFGELLYEFTRQKHLNGKHLTEATDEEIYSSLEEALKRAGETDAPMTDEEFKEWQSKN